MKQFLLYMDFNTETIDKIIDFKTIKDQEKIDRLLRKDHLMYCNLGLDSTKRQKNKIKKNSRYIYRAISKINYEMGRRFLRHQDK